MATVARIPKDDGPPASPSLAAAMALAFGEIESATKSANNPHFKSKYADLTAVIEAVKPALIKHNLFFTQHPHPSQGGVEVETVLHHASGESLSLGALFVPANKQDAQGYGSALTYARRYALVTAFGVPVEDDDGNAAARSQNRAPADDRQTPPRAVESDVNLIIQLCEAVGGNQPALILNAYKIGSLPELTPSQAKAVIGKLNDKLAERARNESNAKGAGQ